MDHFVVPHNLSGGDDMPTLTALNSTIIFKKGITYNFFSAIRLPVLQNVEIRIEGNMSYLEDIPALQGGFPWMTFTGGTNVTLRGTPIASGWWDAMTNQSPSGIWFHNITGGTIRDMKIYKRRYCEGSHGLSPHRFGFQQHLCMGENFLYRSGLYGARFKSFTGGPGLTRNVTYRNIRFVDTVFPIYVTQNYFDQERGTRPVIPANPDPDNATHIEDFLDIGPKEGSCISNPCWFFVANATGREVVILDLYPGTATNVRTKNIVAQQRAAVRWTCCVTPRLWVVCNKSSLKKAESVQITNDVGFICQDGAFIRTKAEI
ncbi:glycoside hydrolase family 28 protein [Mycena olivaceomarginata]|nr:glycoside hydrolase family 28 protein [Mycena olivaceomarginata]